MNTTSTKEPRVKFELTLNAFITPIVIISFFFTLTPACKKSTTKESGESAPTNGFHPGPEIDTETESTAAEARRLVQKAVRTAGGKAALKKNLSMYTTRSNGERYNAAFESLTSWKEPDTLLMVLNSGEQRILLKNNTCKIQDKGVTFECTRSRRKELVQTAWMTHLSHLYPLLDDSIILETGPDAILETRDGTDRKEVFSIIAKPKSVSLEKRNISQKDAQEKKTVFPGEKSPVILYFDKKSYHLTGIGIHEETHPQTYTLFERHNKDSGILLPEEKRLIRGDSTIVKEGTTGTKFGVFEKEEAEKAVFTRWEHTEICNLPARTYALSKHANHYESFHEVVEHFAKRMHNDGLIMTGPAEVAVLTRFRDIKNIRKIPLEIRIPCLRARDSKTSPGGLVTRDINRRRALCLPTRGTMAQALDRLSRLKVQAKRTGAKISDPVVRIFPAQGMKEGHRVYELIVPFRPNS